MKLRDIEFAFDFVADAPPSAHTALVSRSTGETFFQSDLGDSDELPDDAYESDDYLEIPHFKELLGQDLVREFVVAEIPERRAEVQDFFRGPGGYRLYKRLLQELGLLESWHEFENRRRREAVVAWCRDHGLRLDNE